jgi:succinoglycan biosynthesis transport protein ExoP
MTGTGGGAVRLIRVYAVWIVLVTGVVIAAAVGMSMTAPRVYRSDAIVVVESRVRANTTPVAPDMGTEKELARSGVVVDPAAQSLGITSGQLLEGLVVSVAPDANVLTFEYTDAVPATAQTRAESLATAYVSYRNASETPAGTPTGGSSGAASTSTQHATLVTDAVVPGVPVARSIWINVGLGLVIGLVLGIGTALIRDRMSDRIRGRDDFEQISGTTVLATVPRQRGQRRAGVRPVLLRDPGSSAAESFRYLRSRLQPQLRGAATILVTSAGEREGRTTTAANLAIAMAQGGLSVVLLDADMRDPRVHTVFGNDNAVGLTSVLAGEATIKQALQMTSVDRLRLLGAGPAAGNAADLLVGSRLRPILDALRGTCDLVIIDSGPVLSVSDPIALAALCDHVLLVGDFRRTTRRYVVRALGELAEVVHGNVSAVLLNAPRRAGGLVPTGRIQQAGLPPVAIATAQPASGSAQVVGAKATSPKPPVPTVYGKASASAPTIPGYDRMESSDPESPLAAGEFRRRLTRRG